LHNHKAQIIDLITFDLTDCMIYKIKKNSDNVTRAPLFTKGFTSSSVYFFFLSK
jgi:phage terminase large subunit-like protein